MASVKQNNPSNNTSQNEHKSSLLPIFAWLSGFLVLGMIGVYLSWTTISTSTWSSSNTTATLDQKGVHQKDQSSLPESSQSLEPGLNQVNNDGSDQIVHLDIHANLDQPALRSPSSNTETKGTLFRTEVLLAPQTKQIQLQGNFNIQAFPIEEQLEMQRGTFRIYNIQLGTVYDVYKLSDDQYTTDLIFLKEGVNHLLLIRTDKKPYNKESLKSLSQQMNKDKTTAEFINYKNIDAELIEHIVIKRTGNPIPAEQ